MRTRARMFSNTHTESRSAASTFIKLSIWALVLQRCRLIDTVAAVAALAAGNGVENDDDHVNDDDDDVVVVASCCCFLLPVLYTASTSSRTWLHTHFAEL